MDNEAKGLSLFQQILLTILVMVMIPLASLWYITLSAVFAVAYGLGRRFALPLKKLTRITDSISRGKPHREVIGETRGDEIGALARASRGADPFGYRGEFLQLVGLAAALDSATAGR